MPFWGNYLPVTFNNSEVTNEISALQIDILDNRE